MWVSMHTNVYVFLASSEHIFTKNSAVDGLTDSGKTLNRRRRQCLTSKPGQTALRYSSVSHLVR